MVVLITGASSGIGNEAARLLAAKGHKVYAAARRMELLEPLRQEGITPLRLDVTDEASCRDCVQTVTAAEGRIDVLVNNAGYGSLGPIECVPMEEARRQVDTNLLGMAYLCSLVIPFMRSRHCGRIINISSVAGKVAVLFGGWYNVSKFGVEALSDNLRIELKQFGIKVIKIQPGGIKTPWGLIAADHLDACADGSAYDAQAHREAAFLRKYYSKGLLTPPAAVARDICRAATSRRPRIRYRPGLGATLLLKMHTLIPERWWDGIARFMAS
jgi:NAD(P)-dependent dehydrogenase (short-subunit alcohol dehydrogenase family)